MLRTAVSKVFGGTEEEVLDGDAPPANIVTMLEPEPEPDTDGEDPPEEVQLVTLESDDTSEYPLLGVSDSPSLFSFLL